MKQVFIVNNGSKAAQYGIGTYIEQLLLCLEVCVSVQVTVVVLDSTESELAEKWIDGVRYLLFPTVRIHTDEKSRKRYARNVAYALFPYVDPAAEVIFHFNYSYHVGLAEELKSRFPDCYTVLTLHYLPWCFDLAGNACRFRSILMKKEEERDEFEQQIYEEYLNDRRFYNEVDKLICLCNATRVFLHETYQVPAERMALIYNGLSDTRQVLAEADKKEIKKGLGFRENESVILFVGRINRLKGIHWLIDAFRKMLEESPEARLVIAGDGDITECLPLCDGLEEKVIFTGKLDKRQLSVFYRIADLGVLPSLQEQCSYVGIEMMMQGLPLVGTNAMGVSEMVNEEYQVPLLISENNVSLSASKLSELMLDAMANREKLGRLSRLRFEQCYSLDAMRQEMEQLYDYC